MRERFLKGLEGRGDWQIPKPTNQKKTHHATCSQSPHCRERPQSRCPEWPQSQRPQNRSQIPPQTGGLFKLHPHLHPQRDAGRSGGPPQEKLGIYKKRCIKHLLKNLRGQFTARQKETREPGRWDCLKGHPKGKMAFTQKKKHKTHAIKHKNTYDTAVGNVSGEGSCLPTDEPATAKQTSLCSSGEHPKQIRDGKKQNMTKHFCKRYKKSMKDKTGKGEKKGAPGKEKGERPETNKQKDTTHQLPDSPAASRQRH